MPAYEMVPTYNKNKYSRHDGTKGMIHSKAKSIKTLSK